MKDQAEEPIFNEFETKLYSMRDQALFSERLTFQWKTTFYLVQDHMLFSARPSFTRWKTKLHSVNTKLYSLEDQVSLSEILSFSQWKTKLYSVQASLSERPVLFNERPIFTQWKTQVLFSKRLSPTKIPQHLNWVKNQALIQWKTKLYSVNAEVLFS